MNYPFKVKQLSNEKLVQATLEANRATSESTAILLAHIGEMERRGLYLRKAMPSMFQYAVDVLNFSEAEAYMRIHAARAARRYPIILDLVAEGALHLTAVRLVSQYLTAQNHKELLGAVSHKTKRQIQAELARRFPQPDVPQVLRKLPTPASTPTALTPDAVPNLVQDKANPLEARPSEQQERREQARVASSRLSHPSPSNTTPLSENRYKLQVTLSEATQHKLRQAQQLLRHRVPNGDLSEVLDAALDALLKEEMKRQFGATDRPRARPSNTKNPKAPSPRTRHIPHAVRRDVLDRDGLQCAFLSEDGTRCPETGFLQLHHEAPFAKGGEHSAKNVRVYCRAHNMFEAEKDYGKTRMNAYRQRGSAKSGVREPGVAYLYGRTTRHELCPDLMDQVFLATKSSSSDQFTAPGYDAG